MNKWGSGVSGRSRHTSSEMTRQLRVRLPYIQERTTSLGYWLFTWEDSTSTFSLALRSGVSLRDLLFLS